MLSFPFPHIPAPNLLLYMKYISTFTMDNQIQISTTSFHFCKMSANPLPRIKEIYTPLWGHLSAHRKWDTQHLEQTRTWPCITHQTHNGSTCQNSQTYWNPFPQPRGPKNISVGRQTFLHTPVRVEQDQGKEAASFSATGMTGRF